MVSERTRRARRPPCPATRRSECRADPATASGAESGGAPAWSCRPRQWRSRLRERGGRGGQYCAIRLLLSSHPALLCFGCIDAPLLGCRLVARVPYERVARAIQDLSAPITDRHDRGHHGGIKAVRGQSREEPAFDGDGPHLRVVTAQVDSAGTDSRLETRHRLLCTGGCPSKGDKSVGTKAETGESEATYRKAVARDVVPFRVGLKGRLARLHGRRRRWLRDGWLGQPSYDEHANRNTHRDEQEEALIGHEPESVAAAA